MEWLKPQILWSREEADGLIQVGETYVFDLGNKEDKIFLDRDLRMNCGKKMSDRVLVGEWLDKGGQVVGLNTNDFFNEVANYPEVKGGMFCEEDGILRLKNILLPGDPQIVMNRLKVQVMSLLRDEMITLDN